MFCPNCGTQAPDDSAFCPNCGATMTSPEPAPPPVVTPPPMPGPPVMPAAASVTPVAPAAHVAPMAAPGVVVAAGPYPRAPMGGRFFAFLLDSIIGSALLGPALLFLYAGIAKEEASMVGWALFGVGMLWQLIYTLGRDGLAGAGPGKRLTGLVVTSSASGAPAGMGAAIIRQLVLYALNLVPAVGNLIEPIMVLVDKDGRRLGDKAAKTQVARATDVASRGHVVKIAKGGAVAVLVIALLVAIVGGIVGGIAFARAASGAVDSDFGEIIGAEPSQTGTTDTDADSGAPAQAPTSASEAVDDQGTDSDTGATDLNAEEAIDAVGTMLNALKEDDVELARSKATQNFLTTDPGFFSETNGLLTNFEVVENFRDGGTWIVRTVEDWPSGPEPMTYVVTLENGEHKVDGWIDY